MKDPHNDDIALLFNSDYLAWAAYEAARNTGRTIGENVSVIGHDDIAISQLLEPALTTFHFDRERLAAAISQALDTKGLTHFTIPVTMVERASVA